MSKLSSVQANNHRAHLIKRYRVKRTALKSIVMDKQKNFEERFSATLKLAQIPRNSSPGRYRNRCLLTGRSRGNYAKFRLSRIMFRDLASEGMIPGITKSSW